MAFVTKGWLDNDPTTPWSAAAAIDMESRLSGYTDALRSDVIGGVAVPTTMITNPYTAAGAVALTLIGGGSGNPVQAWRDSGTGKTLLSSSNISGLGYAGSHNFFGTNCIGAPDGSGALIGWQQAIDQAAPVPDRDFVTVVKVRATPAAGIVTTAGGTAITAPVGTFDVLNDAGLFIKSANIPSQQIASVADSSHATLTTGTGVLAGTLAATISGARDLEYWFHNGKGYSQVGYFPRAYVTASSTLADAVITGGTNLASATAAFTAANVGQTITVAGAANRVATFVDANHITLAVAAANGSGISFTYFTSVLAPSNALAHWGGPYGNANDPQQAEFIPGVSQTAPVMGIRRLNEAQPVMTWALSGGAAAAPLAPCMSLGQGGGVWGTGGGTALGLFVGQSSPGPAWTIQRSQPPVGVMAGGGLPLSTVSATTSIPVSGGTNIALANAALIQTIYGGTTQTWTVNGATSAGSTSITVNSQTATYPFPTGTMIVTSGLSRIATIQNSYNGDGGSSELAFVADVFTFAKINAYNPNHTNGEGLLTISVGSSGGQGTLGTPGIVVGKNGVAFNGVAIPPAPSAAAAAATGTATAVAATASTQTTPYGYSTQAQADAIVTALNILINTDMVSARATANNARAILRSVGLAL